MKRVRLNKELKCASVPFWSTDKSEMYQAVIDLNDENTDAENGLFYAVKVLRNNHDYAENSLLKEMKITHLIENLSPQSVIIPILMVCGEKDSSYAVMQFKKNGKFLNELIYDMEKKYGKGQIPLEYLLTLLNKILSSLQYVHHCMGDKGFLHLDIQPCNVFVENVDEDTMEFGTVKFIDFENSQPVGFQWNRNFLKNGETVNYTEGFSAPEIFELEKDMLEYSTDLFSVAAIMYRMVTGENFCSAENIDKIEVPGFSILTYQLRQFFKCGLEYNYRYRYWDVASVKKAVGQIEVCLEAYKNCDLYQLLSTAYVNWIPQQEMVVDKETFTSTAFHLAVSRLSETLMQNGIDLRRCDYIFEGLWKIKEAYAEKISGKDVCRLISDGISLSNHLGNAGRGIMLYKELDKYKNLISVMEYTQITNRIAVIFADHYEFLNAYQCIKGNIAALELLKDTYQKMADIYQMDSREAAAVYDLARAYSAMGCYMVLLHKEDPMYYFEKAIKEFDWQTGNIAITWSHIMHYAIQIEDGSGNGRALYEQYSLLFFEGEKDLQKRYQAARKELLHEQRPNPYPMWIFLKGLLYFYSENFKGLLRKTIIDDFYEEKYEKYDAFPILLIYRYLALLEYKQNGNVKNKFVSEAFRRSLLSCEEAEIRTDIPLNILMCMNYETQSIWNRISENQNKNEDLLETLLFHAQKEGWTYLAEKIQQTGSFEGLLEFEYC